MLLVGVLSSIKMKKTTRNIRTFDKKLSPLECYEFEYNGIKLFVHKYFYLKIEKEWTVTEFTTGANFIGRSNKKKTIKEAIEFAKLIIDTRSVEECEKQIKLNLFKYREPANK